MLLVRKGSVTNDSNNSESIEESELIYTPETIVYDDRGEVIGKIIVTEVETPKITPYFNLYYHSEPLKNKSYNIHYIGGALNLGFGITVSGGKIIDAYDPWHNGFFYALTPDDLKSNNYQASLAAKISILWEGFPVGTTSRLKAKISGGNLITTYEIP